VAGAPAPSAPKPAAPPADPVTARLAAGRELLAEGSTAQYAVQLMMTDARERGYLEGWLAEAGRAVKPEQIYLFPAGGDDMPRIGVLYGAFRERPEAIAALAKLPEPLKVFRPYVRPLEAVRDDVRRAGPWHSARARAPA